MKSVMWMMYILMATAAGEDNLEYLQRLKLQVRKPPLPFLLTTTLPDTHTPYTISHDANTFN